MSKVMLTREQANALEFLKKDGWDNSRIIREHVSAVYIGVDRWSAEVKALSELSIETLVLAVVIGYEVEQTPEEKLLQEYWHHKNHVENHWRYYADGMKNALYILGITIPGINGETNE